MVVWCRRCVMVLLVLWPVVSLGQDSPSNATAGRPGYRNTRNGVPKTQSRSTQPLISDRRNVVELARILPAASQTNTNVLLTNLVLIPATCRAGPPLGR
jgi:hypothetical protein